ncbi:MAG: hypothetical protein ACM31O_04540 [Bacteroidota bacterium]
MALKLVKWHANGGVLEKDGKPLPYFWRRPFRAGTIERADYLELVSFGNRPILSASDESQLLAAAAMRFEGKKSL